MTYRQLGTLTTGLNKLMSIVNHSSRLIFIYIPKTGGSSIERLSCVGGKGHDTLARIKRQVAPDIYQSYFKFGIVRNPWARLVSAYSYFEQMTIFHKWYRVRENRITRRRIKAYPNCSDFVSRFQLKDFYSDIHFIPQCRFVCDDERSVALDYVGKLEQLEDGWRLICDRIGQKYEPLPRRNSTVHKDYRSYYSDEAAEHISEQYAEDINQFGYTFDNGC